MLDHAITADGDVLLLAGVYHAGVEADAAPGGNPWHDPRTGRFTYAPPGVRVLRGVDVMKAMPGKSKRMVENVRKGFRGVDAMTADRTDDRIVVHLFVGPRVVSRFEVPALEKQPGGRSRGTTMDIGENRGDGLDWTDWNRVEAQPIAQQIRKREAYERIVDELRHFARFPQQGESKSDVPGMRHMTPEERERQAGIRRELDDLVAEGVFRRNPVDTLEALELSRAREFRKYFNPAERVRLREWRDEEAARLVAREAPAIERVGAAMDELRDRIFPDFHRTLAAIEREMRNALVDKEWLDDVSARNAWSQEADVGSVVVHPDSASLLRITAISPEMMVKVETLTGGDRGWMRIEDLRAPNHISVARNEVLIDDIAFRLESLHEVGVELTRAVMNEGPRADFRTEGFSNSIMQFWNHGDSKAAVIDLIRETVTVEGRGARWENYEHASVTFPDLGDLLWGDVNVLGEVRISSRAVPNIIKAMRNTVVEPAAFHRFKTVIHEGLHISMTPENFDAKDYTHKAGRFIEEGMVETISRVRAHRILSSMGKVVDVNPLDVSRGSYPEETMWTLRHWFNPMVNALNNWEGMRIEDAQDYAVGKLKDIHSGIPDHRLRLLAMNLTLRAHHAPTFNEVAIVSLPHYDEDRGAGERLFDMIADAVDRVTEEDIVPRMLPGIDPPGQDHSGRRHVPGSGQTLGDLAVDEDSPGPRVPLYDVEHEGILVDVNSKLRSGEDLSPDDMEMISIHDDMFARAEPARRGFTAWRGMPAEFFPWSVGDEYTDRAFESWSWTKRIANSYVPEDDGVLIRASVPKGSRAVKYLDDPEFPFDAQTEVLMDRDTRWRVVSDEEVRGQRVVRVEMVGQRTSGSRSDIQTMSDAADVPEPDVLGDLDSSKEILKEEPWRAIIIGVIHSETGEAIWGGNDVGGHYQIYEVLEDRGLIPEDYDESKWASVYGKLDPDTGMVRVVQPTLEGEGWDKFGYRWEGNEFIVPKEFEERINRLGTASLRKALSGSAGKIPFDTHDETDPYRRDDGQTMEDRDDSLQGLISQKDELFKSWKAGEIEDDEYIRRSDALFRRIKEADDVRRLTEGDWDEDDHRDGLPQALALDRFYAKWGGALSESEFNGLKAYRNESWFREINGYLRDPDVRNEIDSDTENLRTHKLHAYVRGIDSAIDSAPPLEESTTVFRGVDGDVFADLKEGDLFQDTGYTSVTTGIAVAEDYSSGFVVRIDVPEGTRMAWMRAHEELEDKDPEFGGNNEGVLARASLYEIIRLDARSDDENFDVLLRLLDPAEYQRREQEKLARGESLDED